MSGRSRRNAPSRAQKVSGVLADLVAAREGSVKRAAAYSYKEEDDVFEEVDEERYAQLVTKRRIEAGETWAPPLESGRVGRAGGRLVGERYSPS
jgi:hypothetical protein